MKAEEFLQYVGSDDRWNSPLIPWDRRHSASLLLSHESPALSYRETSKGGEVVAVWSSIPNYPAKSFASVLSLFPSATGGISFGVDCGCGTVRCSHPHAAILKLRKGYDPEMFGQEAEREAWDNFFGNVEAAPKTPETQLRIVDAEPGLLLIPESDSHLARVRVEPFLSTRNRKGEREARSAMPVKMLIDGLSPRPKAGWPEGAGPMIQSLLVRDLIPRALDPITTFSRAREPKGVSTSSIKQIEAVLTLLPKMKLSWETYKNEMGQGPTRTVEMAWTMVEDGVQKLEARIDGALFESLGMATFSLGDHGFYVDRKAGLIGPLAGSAASIQAGLSMPSLNKRMADDVRRRLAGLSTRLQVPLPAPSQASREIRVPPVAHLRLHNLEGVVMGLLWYTYDGRRLPRDVEGYLDLVENGERIQVFRDRAAEQEMLLSMIQVVPLQVTNATKGEILIADTAKPYISKSDFLSRVLPHLLELGVRYYLPGDASVEVLDSPDIFDGNVEAVEGTPWLEVGLGIDVGGKRVNLLPIFRNLLQTDRLDLVSEPTEEPGRPVWVDVGDNKFVAIPQDRLRAMVTPIMDWLRAGKLTKEGNLKIRSTAFGSLEEIADGGHAQFRASHAAESILERIRNRRTECVIPESFKGVLRPYQKEGVDWMGYLSDLGLGGLLADDMGLGKTVQVIAHIVVEKDLGRLKEPVLVIVPMSLINQWMDRCKQFAPHLSVLKLHGSKRASLYDQIGSHDLVITTYALLHRDIEVLGAQQFSLMVMDETSNIKSAKTQAAKASRDIRAHRRLALGGSPVENNLGELWAAMDAAEHGVLGTEKEFTDHFRRPIEKQNDPEARKRLLQRIAPLILRRKKEDVAKDLPPKIIAIEHPEMEQRQRDIYEAARTMINEEVMQLLQEKGLANSGMMALEKMLKLRQIADSPKLLKDGTSRDIPSCKEQWLEENVPKLLADGRRILIFSEWAEMIAIVADMLDRLEIRYSKIQGDVSQTDRVIALEEFKSGQTNVFLITTKSGGVGLDIPEADTVIHCDPNWNPQAENQATDRAHRIGQVNSVMVYKLIVRGTVEEHILTIQGRKSALANSIMDNQSAGTYKLTEEDIKALLAPMPSPGGNGGEGK